MSGDGCDIYTRRPSILVMADENNKEKKEVEKENSLPPPPPPGGKIPPKEDPPPSPMRSLIFWVLILIAVGSFIFSFTKGRANNMEISGDSEFRKLVAEKRIAKCEFVREAGGKTYLTGVRFDATPQIAVSADTDKGSVTAVDAKKSDFIFYVMPDSVPELEEFLRSSGVDYKIVYKSAILMDLMIQIIPFVLFIFLLYFFIYRQGRGGPMSFAKSKAHRLSNGSRPRITFRNVAGVEEAKEEVQEIIEFLRAPQKFAKLGGRIPKGVLLMGPPGTGKTLLAKAIAGEAGVPFFSISGSDFVEMFVGVGASRVRDMFETAKKNSPCIIFIDEIDAVGRSRFTGIGGGHDEREQTLNALLVEMDGFETTDGVIVIAATNRPDVLDKALLRPGRFDRQIVIDLPTLEGRYKILKVHAKKISMAKEVDLVKVARGTPGFSGADLANLLNEAALRAASLGKTAVEQIDLEESRDKVWWGRERPGRMTDKEEKRLTAYHEAGHAVVMALIKGGEPLHKITIIPRGMALGATMFLPKKDRVQYTRTQMLAMLATDMGGRVAEELFLDDISSGAQQDLRQATSLAHQMVCDWGMSAELGPRTFGVREEMMFLGREVGRQQDYSDATAQKIDAEVGRLVNDAYKTATELLETNRDKVELLVAELLDKETVDGEDATDIIKFGRIRTFEERYPDGVPVDENIAAIDADLAEMEKEAEAKTEAPKAEAAVKQEEEAPAAQESNQEDAQPTQEPEQEDKREDDKPQP